MKKSELRKIIREELLRKNKINEGTWDLDKSKIPTMIKELEKFKEKWWNIVGDDDVYDGIDASIRRLNQLKKSKG